VRNFREETEIRKFIITYLEENFSADATDEKFHTEFYERFGGKRKQTYWGAQTVYKAQKWLKKLYDEGTLDRGVINLGANWQPGFPRWVYGYTLSSTSRYTLCLITPHARERLRRSVSSRNYSATSRSKAARMIAPPTRDAKSWADKND